MMYDNAVDQIKGLKAAKDAVELPFHLAKVTSLSNGRAYVQFYGDSSPSSKLYPYLEGYKPTVNDDVLMLRQGSTYIIAGKISKDNISDNYYLLESVADALYLTEAAADEKYAPIDSKPSKIWNNKYWFGFNSGNDAEVLSFRSDGTLTEPTHVSLGNNANPFTKLFVKDITLYDGGDIVPYQTSGSDLGTTSKMFEHGYFNTLGDNSLSYSIQNLNARNVKIFGQNVVPDQNNYVNLGTSSSKQFNNVYAKQFYQNGTAISTSDKRKKKTIKDITKKYIDFFRKLRPRTFVFRDGESGRTHCGFIAQEVEEAANEAGIDNKDLAFLCIDKDGSYGLRYEELIALQTQIIQDLLVRVEILEEGSKK